MHPPILIYCSEWIMGGPSWNMQILRIFLGQVERIYRQKWMGLGRIQGMGVADSDSA